MATAMAASSPPKPSKRLIVCCDGTWMSGDHAKKDDSSYQTNITRMCHAIAKHADMPDGTKIPQIIYYQSGVGSGSPTILGSVIEGVTGFGVNENILSAYNFLVNNYTPNDELFFFGFSRGSFTCRSLAGMVSQCGILKQEEAGEWFSGIWERYQGTRKHPRWEKDGGDLTYNVDIKLIGCWDTVGSLGIPESFLTKLFNLNSEHAFHNTNLSDKVENAFHALALDEHRVNFKPTLWYIPPEQGNVTPARRTKLKQCWFAGVHTDVGRGYDDHVPGDTADITFAWMVDQCRGLLAFHDDKIPKMLEKGDFKGPEGDWAERDRDDEERERRVAKAINWGLADLHDSMTFPFKLFRPVNRTPGQYVLNASGFLQAVEEAWYARLWSTVSGVFTDPPKDIPKLISTSEVIHPSVRMRRTQDPTYDPPALRGFNLHYDAAESRWTWIKKWTDHNGVIREHILDEERIEKSSFSMINVPQGMLKFRADEKEPIPPKPKSGWRF